MNIAEIEKKIKENAELLTQFNLDPELKILAEAEKKELEEKKQKLLASSPKPIQEVILEIRPGTGGEEASLFARDLARMYQRFAERKNWKITLLDEKRSDLGGVREIIFLISGAEAEKLLSKESGVHRVQRIPLTEKSGRIHTSTATVAVLPKPSEKEIKIKPQDLRIDTYRASGPGGQYVNRRESAVRILHLPSGLVVTSQTSRTQVQNRENALAILRAKLWEQEQTKMASEQGEQRRTQIGTGERAEKIRTYNFPQDRVTDHRLRKSWHHIAEILNGKLDPIVEALSK